MISPSCMLMRHFPISMDVLSAGISPKVRSYLPANLVIQEYLSENGLVRGLDQETGLYLWAGNRS